MKTPRPPRDYGSELDEYIEMTLDALKDDIVASGRSADEAQTAVLGVAEILRDRGVLGCAADRRAKH